MKLKYIMLEHKIGETSQFVPIFFFEPITHAGMWDIFEHSGELPGRVTLRSAGFVQLPPMRVDIVCFGESESLKQKGLPYLPAPGDADIIRHHNYFHGIA